MNSLIGLGALTSFAAGVAAPLVPGMAFDASFLEEPVMLLAFVLLGRTLEARARLKASGKPLLRPSSCSTLRRTSDHPDSHS
jgi:cation transport ATPase